MTQGRVTPPTGTRSSGGVAASPASYGAHVGGSLTVQSAPSWLASEMSLHITWSPIVGETLKMMLSLTAASAAMTGTCAVKVGSFRLETPLGWVTASPTART